jgi:Allene oxide cyclase
MNIRQLVSRRPLSSLAAAAVLLLSTQAHAGQPLLVVERAVVEKTVHVAGPSDSLGNLLVFANPVYDAANRAQVGRDQGYCIRVAVGRSWECFWTLILKDGQITTEGPYYDRGDSIMAITGGTARYAGAKGTVRVHPRDPKSSSYDFRYELQ